MIEFNEAEHIYTVKGRRLPSVTQVLKPLYGDLRFVKQDLLDYKSALGVAVHKAVELHILDGLDYSSLVSPVAEYFDQFLEWEASSGWEPVLTEIKVSSALGYAGTLDIIAIKAGEVGLVDLKTTAVLSPAVALQTSAYAQAYNELKQHRVTKRFALRLTPDKYRFQPYQDASDFAVFLSMLKIHQWCEATGKTYEVTQP